MSTPETKVVAVSDSELAMLNLAREKAELKKKELLLEKEGVRLKNIKTSKQKIKKALDDNAKLIDATQVRFDEFERLFPGEFKLVKIADDVKTEKLEDWDYDSENENRINEKVYFEEQYKLKQFEIRYKGLKTPIILVKEHLVDIGYSRYSWKSHGFKMVTKGVDYYKEDKKYYTNIKTIRDKIIWKIDSENSAKEQERIHKAGIPWLIKAVKGKYGAALKEAVDYCNNVRAQFKNGLVVLFHYTYDEDKNEYGMTVMEVDPSYLKKEDVIDALMVLKKYTGE